jgi:hypothetical protein
MQEFNFRNMTVAYRRAEFPSQLKSKVGNIQRYRTGLLVHCTCSCAVNLLHTARAVWY